MNEIIIGSYVRFYDCYKANKDRNYSGESKYWVIGKVVNRRITTKKDDVVDIQLADGRISNGHFTSGVQLQYTKP